MEGIIFDLDGTLVDSEPLHGRAWLDILKEQGLSFDWEWFEGWIGKSDRLLAEYVIDQHAIPLEVPDLQRLKRTAYYRLVAKELKLFPGVLEGLGFLSAKLPVALATSSSASDVEAVFAAQPISHLFRSIVHADHVLPNLKPKPDPYLLAAKNIGVDPKKAVALEDSVAGVKSAKAAGMLALAVTNSHSALELKEADRIFSSTAEAMDWIKSQLPA
ncbi:MAG: HAD family phosphatase [Saprospiraceae bacterium]|nr:HAD family phosphatase [Saprospiraceae bacterium]